MTDTAAAFYDAHSFDCRIFRLADARRVIRVFLAVGDGVIVGLGAVAGVGLLIAAVTLAAVWMAGIALSTNPHIQAMAPSGLERIALTDRYPALAGPMDVAASAPVEAPPAAAAPSTFEAKWARVTAPASAPGGAAPGQIAKVIAVTPAAPLPQPLPPKAMVEAVPAPSVMPRPAVAETAPERTQTAIAQPAVKAAAPVVAAAPSPPVAPAPKSAPPQQAHNKSPALPGADSRTAVYDISAHTVYLPNGDKLEAHSGLGDNLDDPRYVHVRMRGPTPPNVYELTLREQLFHGVRAIRLNPVDEGKMFGRDGMLAHTYMLGPNGQSNGCVSFRDYQAFLRAYQRGEIDRLVVVPHLGDTPVRSARRTRGRDDDRYAANNPPAETRALTW